MDQSAPFVTEALQILGRYYRTVVTKVAEEIVENCESFEDPTYAGRAEEVIDRYGHHLQNIARVHSDLMSLVSVPGMQGCGNFPGAPVPQSGRAIGADFPLETGSKVLAEQCGAWWQAVVVSVEADGRATIHYEGWDDTWNETVPRSRLQHLSEEPKD